MGKSKPRVRASLTDKPPTSRNRGKGKVPKTNTAGVAAELAGECDSVAAVADTCRQTTDSTGNDSTMLNQLQ